MLLPLCLQELALGEHCQPCLEMRIGLAALVAISTPSVLPVLQDAAHLMAASCFRRYLLKICTIELLLLELGPVA